MSDVRLIHGDCLDVLKTLPDGSVDAVVTDPPYGYSYETNRVVATTTASWMRKPIAGDDDTGLRDAVLSDFQSVPWACFGSMKRAAPNGTRGTLIWDKGPASGMGDLSFPWKGSYELIFVGGKGWSGHRGEGVLKGFTVVTRKSMGRVHPNEKPVKLIEHLLGKLPEGCTILDPFMGSGTTGVACVNTGRNFIGIELDAGYFAIAQKRIADAQEKILIPA